MLIRNLKLYDKFVFLEDALKMNDNCPVYVISDKTDREFTLLRLSDYESITFTYDDWQDTNPLSMVARLEKS